MAENDFDLIVIGAGPGGYVAAIRAAQLGMRVACVEKDKSLGGTCLNVGCIPSKALLDSSELYHQAKHSFGRHGIRAEGIGLDLAAMMGRKDQVVQTLTRGVAGLFRKNKVEHVLGTARIVARGTVEVRSNAEAAGAARKEGGSADQGDHPPPAPPSREGGEVVTSVGKRPGDGAASSAGASHPPPAPPSREGGEVRTLKAGRILIATGSAPTALPSVPFDGRFIVSSTEALMFQKVPQRLVIIGAGAIGLELGSVWSRLGSEVLVLEFMDRILPLMDREVTSALQRSLQKQGLTFKLQTSAESAKVEGEKVRLKWASGEERGEEVCDRVLVAIGRRPYTEGLGLREVGVEMDRRGFIRVDESFATTVEGIYAIGDVIGGAMLAHKSEEEGIAAVEMMAGRAGHVNYLAVPNVVYTFPELASVGLTEEEARGKGYEIRIGKFPYTANGRARCLDATEGLVKVIGDARTDRLLGLHILAARASDLIAEGAVAMEFASSVEDIARSVHAHPTLPEAIKEAALAAAGRAIHI